MTASNKSLKSIFLYLLFLCFSISSFSQEKKVALTTKELFNEIEKMDSTIFEAFNTRNMEKFKSLFAEDLEWFQDNGGLLSYNTHSQLFSGRVTALLQIGTGGTIGPPWQYQVQLLML